MTEQSADEFDFEAFIKGARLPHDDVTFYLADHRDEITALEKQLDDLDDGLDDKRLNSRKATTEKKALAEKIRDLRDAMEASKRTVKLRALTPDEYKAVNEDDDQDLCDQLAVQSVSPKLTVDQWRKLGALMGSGQFIRIANVANTLALGSVESPDFSQSVLDTLGTGRSSKS